MQTQLPKEEIIYYNPYKDRNMHETVIKMVQQAYKTDHWVAIRIGKHKFVVKPHTSYQRAETVWKRLWAEWTGRKGSFEVSETADDRLLRQEVFNVGDPDNKNNILAFSKGHSLYYQEIHSNDPEAAVFLNYWGKYLQLEQKKGEKLTKKLAYATMIWASEKTKLTPTKQMQELMTAIWVDGEKLAEVLGQNATYCRMHRLIKNDANMFYYLGQKEGKIHLKGRGNAERAERMMARVLGNAQAIQDYYKIMINTRKFTPEERLQVKIPGLPQAEETISWISYLKTVSVNAQRRLCEGRKTRR